MVQPVFSLLLALTAPLVLQDDFAPSASVSKIEAVDWFDGSYNAALSEARKKQRDVVLVFAPEWSTFSAKLRSETLLDPAAVAVLQASVCLDIDPDTPRGA